MEKYKTLIYGFEGLPTYNIIEGQSSKGICLFKWYNPYHWFIRLVTPLIFRHRQAKLLSKFSVRNKR